MTSTWTRSRTSARSAISCRSRSSPSTIRTASSCRARRCCASKTARRKARVKARRRGVTVIQARAGDPKGQETTPMPEGAERGPGDADYAELAELAGGFIHEIKNHLGTLGLNFQLLAEDFQEPQSQRERRALTRVQRLEGECKRLVDLANDFLRFASLKELELAPADLARVI